MRKSKIMKALLVFGMSVVTAASMVSFAACNDTTGGGGGTGGGNGGGNGGGGNNDCNHEYTGTYNTYWADANGHWHECDVCEQEADRGAHVDDNHDNECDTCGWEIAHKFATEWTTGPDGHYKAAECSHTTEKAEEGPHVDEDSNNVCDTCGYTGATSTGYTTYKTDKIADTVKVIDETFFVAKTLPLFDNWGTAGLYASHNNETNKVTVSGGQANLITPAKEPATCLYVDWGNVVASTVKGYFKINDVKGTNGYTSVQFTTSVDGKDSELFGVRTNKGGVYKYRLNGGSEVAGDSACTAAWANGGEFYYEYNAITNKITMTINGQAFVTDLQLTGNTLKGIKFSSGSGNADTFSVDDIAAYKTVANLETYKTAITAQATELKGKIHEDVTVNVADLDLSTAADNDACDAALATYTADLLSAYKTAAEAKIKSTYLATNYDDAKNQDAEAYTAAIAKLETDVAAATTVAKVTTAYTTAKTTISALGDDDFWGLEDVTITIGNGTEGNNTVTVKEGVEITKADLDAHVTVESGKKVVGYYTDSTYATEVTVPFNATVSTTIYAKIDNKVTTTYTLDTSKVSGTAYTAETLINDIFYVNNKVKSENGNKMAGGYAKQVSLTGGMASTTQNAIKFTVTGETTVTVVLGAKSDKPTVKLSVLNADGEAVTLTNVTRNGAESGLEYLPVASSNTVKPDTYTFTLAAGTYYLGGSGGGAYLYALSLEVEA